MVRKVIMGELKNMKEGKSVGMSSNVVEMLKNGSISQALVRCCTRGLEGSMHLPDVQR